MVNVELQHVYIAGNYFPSKAMSALYAVKKGRQRHVPIAGISTGVIPATLRYVLVAAETFPRNSYNIDPINKIIIDLQIRSIFRNLR